VRILVNKLALAGIFYPGRHVSSVVIIPPMLHTRILLNGAIRRRKGESLVPSKTICGLQIGDSCAQSIFNTGILYRVMFLYYALQP
jgi:hypothetical protein